MNAPFQLLYVDANQSDCAFICSILASDANDFQVTIATTLSELVSRLIDSRYDLVVSDLNINGCGGLQIIDTFHAHAPQMPVIIVTGNGSEEVAVAALKRGVADYIPKKSRQIHALPERIRDALKQQSRPRTSISIGTGFCCDHPCDVSYNPSGSSINAPLVEEAFLRTMAEQTPRGTLLVDAETLRILEANSVFQKLLGYTPEELQQLTLYDIIAVIPHNWQQMAQQDQGFVGERQHRRKDGSLVDVDVSASFITYRSKQALCVIVRDITAQKRAEEKFRVERDVLAQRVAARTADLSTANAQLARAARLKDEFLASMSHELRTPLNVILGQSEVLQEELYGPLTPKQAKSIRMITESGEHLLDLINDVLDLAKIEAGKVTLDRQSLNIAFICKASLQFIKQLAQKKAISISSSIDPCAITMDADGRRLKQILVNLLTNAVKFTPEGGRIGLDVQIDPQREVVNFTVWDTGIGIAPADKDRLFQPFVQLDGGLDRQHNGTGLGLSLVSHLADLHGGNVVLESEVGRGSRFTVSLPWNQTIAADSPGSTIAAITTPVADAMITTAGTTVLLVEDNETNIITIADYLSAQDYQVILAHNGNEALDQASQTQPDIILMDIQMPGMDGLETICRLRADELTARTPIIALTALAMPGDRDRCMQVGANDYLSKPVKLHHLIEKIEALVNGQLNALSYAV